MAELKNPRILQIILSLLIVVLVCSSALGKTIYVDGDITGANDGSSWADAYPCLQDALAVAQPGDNIWVAQGIYYPDEGNNVTDSNRNESFNIPDKVKVYGGFSGTESNSSERDVSKNETILSGDLQQDDEISGNNDNAYHVVCLTNVSEQTILDGFTITAGNAMLDPINAENIFLTDGGGILNNGSGNISCPQIINCTINGNNARRGGGMFNDGTSSGLSSPSLINCVITNNSATFGGGICNQGYTGNSSPLLTNCIISRNTSTFIAGGMLNGGRSGGESSPTLLNCIISGNINHGNNGGGIYNNGADNGTSSPTFTNCIISGNSTANIGGGMFNSGIDGGKSDAVLVNCTISGNYAVMGSGIYNRGSDSFGIDECSTNLNNCIVWDNFTSNSQIFNEIASPSYSYCDIEGGVRGNGNIDQDPLFADPGYWADVNDPNVATEPNDPNAVWIDGDYHLKSEMGRWDPNSQSWVQDDVTSPCIDAGDPNSDFSGETWPHGGRINMGAYGGTREASISSETDGKFLPNVAFIFSHRIEEAESFDSLLETYGCSTTLIKLDEITATPLEFYDLLIVANDTQYTNTWDPNTAAAIEDSNKPVLGLGDGGYDFFGLFGLWIGNPNGGHGTKNTIEVIDPNSSLFRTPYSIEIPEDRALRLYTETKHVGIYLWPTIPETVTTLGKEVDSVNYFPLVMQHNRYLLWSFTESPQKMTDLGKTLFINVVIWTANKAWENEN